MIGTEGLICIGDDEKPPCISTRLLYILPELLKAVGDICGVGGRDSLCIDSVFPEAKSCFTGGD